MLVNLETMILVPQKSMHLLPSGSFWASILSGLGVMILGMIFMEPLVRLLGSTDTILPYAKDYAFYILMPEQQ